MVVLSHFRGGAALWGSPPPSYKERELDIFSGADITLSLTVVQTKTSGKGLK